jgi:peptidyl-dipeptidase Dcp
MNKLEKIFIHIITLVMNLTKQAAAKSSLLTYDNQQTFLHEFGHALHGMLSNVHY